MVGFKNMRTALIVLERRRRYDDAAPLRNNRARHDPSRHRPSGIARWTLCGQGVPSLRGYGARIESPHLSPPVELPLGQFRGGASWTTNRTGFGTCPRIAMGPDVAPYRSGSAIRCAAIHSHRSAAWLCERRRGGAVGTNNERISPSGA